MVIAYVDESGDDGHETGASMSVGKWPRTWLKLTPQGRTAFDNHLKTLREIAGE